MQQVASPMPQFIQVQVADGSSQDVSLQSSGQLPNLCSWTPQAMSTVPRTMPALANGPSSSSGDGQAPRPNPASGGAVQNQILQESDIMQHNQSAQPSVAVQSAQANTLMHDNPSAQRSIAVLNHSHFQSNPGSQQNPSAGANVGQRIQHDQLVQQTQATSSVQEYAGQDLQSQPVEQSQAIQNQCIQPIQGIEPNERNLEIQPAQESQTVDGIPAVFNGTVIDRTGILPSQGSSLDPSVQHQSQADENHGIQPSQGLQPNQDHQYDGLQQYDGFQQTGEPQSAEVQTCTFCLSVLGRVSI